MSQSIQIYNGPGASSLCVQAWKRELNQCADTKIYKIEEFNASYTAGLDRGNVALLILPGGNACDMFDPIVTLATKINQIVADKTSFLGSCAGAIVSASNCSMQRFDFNPIPFHSKYYMPKSDSVSDSENKSAIEVEWQSNPCRLFHAFGPVFPLEIMADKVRNDSRALVLYKTDGTKRSAYNSAAAVLYQPPGSTSRLVTGVHPELGVEDVLSQGFAQGFTKPDHPHIRALAENMKDSEIVRKQICRSWFSLLGIKVTDS